MSQRRRQLLCCLGAAGVSAVSGCLRLTEEQQSAAENQQPESESETVSPAFSVRVIGRQFAWAFAYPDFGATGKEELVLPVDQTVEIVTESEDVIHSFHIVELDAKVDAIPDERAKTVVTPETRGEYTAYCAELCGSGHSEMTAPVRVVSQDEFEQWHS